MNIGLLWFFNDVKKATLENHIVTAGEYYFRKYQRKPDTCLVNPKYLEKPIEVKVNGVNVSVGMSRAILPGHIWIGINLDIKDVTRE
jgi:hypothetical protein